MTFRCQPAAGLTTTDQPPNAVILARRRPRRCCATRMTSRGRRVVELTPYCRHIAQAASRGRCAVLSEPKLLCLHVDGVPLQRLSQSQPSPAPAMTAPPFCSHPRRYCPRPNRSDFRPRPPPPRRLSSCQSLHSHTLVFLKPCPAPRLPSRPVLNAHAHPFTSPCPEETLLTTVPSVKWSGSQP